MSTPQEVIQNAMAMEARRRDATVKLGRARREIEITSTIMQMISSMHDDAQRRSSVVTAEYHALQAGGPGVTDDYGFKNPLVKAVEAEFEIGLAATMDAIVAHPAITESEGVAAYDAAVPNPLGPSGAKALAFAATSLHEAGKIDAADWDSLAHYIATNSGVWP